MRVIAKSCYINHAFLIAEYPQAKIDLSHLYANTYRFAVEHLYITHARIIVRYLTITTLINKKITALYVTIFTLILKNYK